ncbi:MAG: DUF11 domain-containing protein, partial [FCB group bacterium]|nr:DUF11 domain-containing protein [FCB group bacterium]
MICKPGDLPVSGTVTITLLVTPTVCDVTITNSAVVTSATFDPNLGNNEDDEDTWVECPDERADLEITKSDDPNSVEAGETLTYTLTVYNHGSSPARQVVVTDTLPPEVTFGAATFDGSSCSADGGQVICEPGDLPVSGTITITLLVTPTVCDVTITNSAVVTSATFDPNL